MEQEKTIKKRPKNIRLQCQYQDLPAQNSK